MGGTEKTSVAAGRFEKNGQTFEVRFFDADSFFDLRDLREIVQSPGVQVWMASVRNMSHKHYRKWMEERGENHHFLFAIADTRVHGFVYLYPSEEFGGALDVSYAKRPGAPGGLITPALVEACKLVRDRMGSLPKMVAEIERENQTSIVAIEKAGFVKMRDFDRYGNGIWTLDWGKI
ncbi:MAG: hypothetical protein UX08_C0029G0007 [Candidatus Collierbacteria bacterium GW2011_GWB1_45_35]|uniref:N-acetyltransferase domain-containing protein n=1 Tax=Candidatus Collierbacteria bacterium GW2011_GWB2_45_17 TaxID=1618388 RepID=A0A837IHJ2_9BACT|nr:MAG: hypothetical protein UW48_C0012G0009 [Microgenomates group bacterium GW2011_GWC1_44_23]KKT94908.1 MAG: hypothetical protein UW96_C0013G0009 [Candidatus Collierbacteria bacterium GW2011_GWA1_45_15]KKT99090.1 MAG: hypothetical protein UX01_C0013G0009 [Candidatus Collierbacteria bacterium GW2011_GWB2_45_17]KKU04338.1 MAG: hypothetical protein UX08_C0029G0007 [Candidatus Collierbacteria bacterium GW2011_GWB1_45_35]KKU07634.1 MAG: hypothetical protein UX11_C0012G0009 [Candidatus Collierbacte